MRLQLPGNGLIIPAGALDLAVFLATLTGEPKREPPRVFLITALDTSGNVTLRRESALAAMKKATELISDGCWNVEVTTPDGATYNPGEFDQLKARVGGLAGSAA
jgi:hypothetical protein